jgi:hypothetical protein
MHGIDEGELEIEPIGHYASSLLYCTMHATKVSDLLYKELPYSFV